ncbi:site-specific DNA-methyltransferase [Helicobacter pylori]|nr:site-specific DNA-methyltransferase [Helicobacter pylori]
MKTSLKTLLDALINHFTKERLETLIIEHDEKLLTFMLEHENANDYKNAFFKTIANTLVFNQEALLECLEIKELEKSFTRFKNKIGLFSQGGLIKSSDLVVLNFPFKDNVLLGSAKDNSTKSNELFYHEILHKKEIDTLLSPKVLCRFEMHGEGDLESALKDKNTNYLIKGNNLIALHSLKKKFAKQVKCIYIDPPYNTGNDSFNYNDNFNHSSWLVFMKNRLEAAREFLSDDGVIFVQCDDNEQAYLKVLMDEIFLRENFVACLHVELSTTQGMKVASAKKGNIVKNAEYILIYSKNMENFSFIRSLYVAKECVKNSPHLANKERLCQKEVHEKFHDPYSSSKELSVQSAISFCIKKVDPQLEKAALMNGVFISPYKKSTHCQRTHLDNKSLKEIALDMNPKLEKQSPFIDADKIAMQSAGLLRKNKGVLIAFATDICMERNEHKKEEFISLKESCSQSQAKIYNNKERFDKFIQDYQKDLKTCLLDTSNTKEEMEQNVSQCQKEQLRDDNKGFTLEELVKKYAK